MACFLIPGTEAVVSTAITKVLEKKEQKKTEDTSSSNVSENKYSLVHKLKWLNSMLWGGSALLAFEHVWHGEVVPYFPFLTAASSRNGLRDMIYEMGTVGVTMAMTVTVVWIAMVGISNAIERLPEKRISKPGR